MKTTRIWIVLLFTLAFALRQSNAGTVLGTAGSRCYSTTFKNPSSRPSISVFGDWIENIDRATTSASGVTVTILGKFNGIQNSNFNGAQNSSGLFPGKGRVDLDIRTNGATAGTATINLINDPALGLGGETFSFTITILAPPTVTSVEVPTPSAPFSNITVTLRGTGLQNAKDPASGVIVQDNLIPLITVGGNASVSSVRVLSSNATSLQAQISFTSLVQDATVELSLNSTEPCVPLYLLPRSTANGVPFKTRVHVKSSNVKNFVKAITFPNGNTIDKNSIGTINIALLFPAPGDGGSVVRLVGRDFNVGKLAQSGNRTVFFRFVPANAFAAVPNGTPINATGFTRVDANVGDNVVPITFKVVDCLGGQPGATNQVKIQTWMHNTNTSQAPEFLEQTFRVRCTQ